MTPERLRKLHAMANQSASPREAEIARRKIVEGIKRVDKPRQHTHNWTNWKIQTGNISKWVNRQTPYSPGGFWMDRWWERECIRGGVVKHVEKRGASPHAPDPIYYPFQNTETRVFVQASGWPSFTQE